MAENNKKTTLGRGLDIGTATLISVSQDEGGEVTIMSQRNAFIDIKADSFTKNMLSQQKVPYVIEKDTCYVIGNDAFDLANIFNRELRRPMKHGLISPRDAEAIPMIKLLIERLIGLPRAERERCYFSMPAEPIDAEMNAIYHKGMFEGVLRKLGYDPKDMLEGHALIFSELADEDFTGIGISCGGGMFNICVSYKTIPALAFSTTRAGDWIDKNVGDVMGMPANKATLIKESGVDLTDPRTREEEAIVIYYRNLINYTLENIKKRFESSTGMPSFPEAISIVCGGGTSLAGGFIEIFKEEYERVSFPLNVKDIRLANDPLNAVAKGCLLAAISGQ